MVAAKKKPISSLLAATSAQLDELARTRKSKSVAMAKKATDSAADKAAESFAAKKPKIEHGDQICEFGPTFARQVHTVPTSSALYDFVKKLIAELGALAEPVIITKAAAAKAVENMLNAADPEAPEGSQSPMIKSLNAAQLALAEHIKKSKERLRGAIPLADEHAISAANECVSALFPCSALSTHVREASGVLPHCNRRPICRHHMIYSAPPKITPRWIPIHVQW